MYSDACRVQYTQYTTEQDDQSWTLTKDAGERFDVRRSKGLQAVCTLSLPLPLSPEHDAT